MSEPKIPTVQELEAGAAAAREKDLRRAVRLAEFSGDWTVVDKISGKSTSDSDRAELKRWARQE